MILSQVTLCYLIEQGKHLYITHPYATKQSIAILDRLPAQLACVRPAASISSEPGSNSLLIQIKSKPNSNQSQINPH